MSLSYVVFNVAFQQLKRQASNGISDNCYNVGDTMRVRRKHKGKK